MRWVSRVTQGQPVPLHAGQARDSLDPEDGVIELRVDGFQVFQRGSLVEHPLVEREGEACVNELPMVQGLRKEEAWLRPWGQHLRQAL